MNEADTRAELIEPALKAAGWGITEGSRVTREYHITDGKIQTTGGRAKPLIADYVLVYQNVKLAVIEAKALTVACAEGVAQAKNYAEKLKLETSFAANGKEIYGICMKTGAEGNITKFPTPDELWHKTFAQQNNWRDAFNSIPFEDVGGSKGARYYQEIAVRNVMEAVANNKQRILLTLATGTGKTFIAFQVAWKLFHSRWNLRRDGGRRPRILFLADRNILANQAFNAFSAFPEDALVRISPKEIAKKGSVPVNGSIFFTIFQTFMSGKDDTPYFGEYPEDYFDFIIIDECHRGGANDEGNWRGILEYFSPAVQLGLTATPKREENADTYKYFGEPVYIYSLKEGINDGFLTPFKVKRFQTTIDEYIYTPDDEVLEGNIQEGKIYKESDFNRVIEIKKREITRVQLYMDDADQRQKAIVFCATQDHAAAIRDIINQYKTSTDPNYCVRVTANDGELGEQYLRDFQDNEKTIPTVLTTSQKLSTGVDARNIRNIVLLRPVNSMIEFKQIIGRGTRLFEGKTFFTIYDFVGAYKNFEDPEWDGEPAEPETTGGGSGPRPPQPPGPPKPVVDPIAKIKIKLSDGKAREIQHMVSTSFWSADGKPMSAEQFIESLFGKLPALFASEQELRTLWSVPSTRKALLEKLEDSGFGKDSLIELQKLINAEKSDIFDVLEYISYAETPITRAARVKNAQSTIFANLTAKQKEFVDFVLSKYIETGVEELDIDKLPELIKLKYYSVADAKEELGSIEIISKTFIDFQKYLYI